MSKMKNLIIEAQELGIDPYEYFDLITKQMAGSTDIYKLAAEVERELLNEYYIREALSRGTITNYCDSVDY